MTLIFDIEADNLLYDITKVWCIVAYDPDLDKTYTYDHTEIDEALDLLMSADVLIGHNIIGYDLPALSKVHPKFKYNGIIFDTLVLSRIRYPLLQSHSLGAWGDRLKLPKTGHTDFSYFSPEMLEYCVNDVKVSTELWKHLDNVMDVNKPWITLEQEVLRIQTKAEEFGVCFDYHQACKLIMDIQCEMETINSKAQEVLGLNREPYTTKLKKDGKPNVHAQKKIDMGYEYRVCHEKCIVYVTTPITLDTKKLLIDRLLVLGWKPMWTTEKGMPQIARKGEPCPNLSSIEGLNGLDIGKYFVLKHRLSLLQGMLKNVRADGRIPSEANTLGAITGRYTHRKIANLPAVRSLYGKEIRALFGVEKGRVQVGSDLAGIEARMLAHFMGDDDYTREVVDGDIHTANQQAAGLPTRDSAKTFFYGFLYGAGDAKVGELVNGGREEGAKIKQQFLDSLPSLSALIEEKQNEAKKGYVTSLDGRPVKITKTNGLYDTRKALNSLLQSSATIYFKQWVVFIDKLLTELNLDATIMILYHDEVQISVNIDHVDGVKSVLRQALEMTDKHFKVRCPNDIDIKTGKNWEDCH